jgi:hypothetical protein
MAKQLITIDSVWNGQSSSQYFYGGGQYLAGVGIDPFLPISDSVGDRGSSGVLRPSGYEAFSGAAVDANPYWIITNPKDTKVYVVLNNGALLSYTSAFGSETDIGTATSSSGNGAAYYNNYIYIATNTDISRYGPLDGSPSLANTWWTSTLSLTQMRNTTYPSIRGSGTLPNHPMHVHADGQLYVGDFDSGSTTDTTRGKGLIHAINTKYGSAEGDTNNGSTYNVLDLPPGYMPTCLASFGEDLVIGAIQQGSDSTLIQGKAALFFWDTISSSFYNVVELPDALVTGLRNNNGALYVFSGSVTTGSDVANGYRMSIYVGGQTTRTIYYSNTGGPPLQGAIDSIGDRLVWGTFDQVQTTTAGSPTYYAVVKAWGTENPSLPSGVHGIINTTATGAAGDGLVTAVKFAQQDSFSKPKLVVGHRDASGSALDKSGTTYGTAVWHSQMFNIGRKGTIKRIRMNFPAAVAANMTLTPKVFTDDFSGSSTSGLTVVNSTNYANSERHVEYFPDINFDHNFVLELTWTGTALLPVLLPIEIEIETHGD